MRRRIPRWLCWIPLAIGALPGGWLRADDAPDPAALAFFESRVRPILVERCQACHGEAKAKGGLRLDTRSGLLAGGGSGPAVIAGKPAESPLVAVIGYDGEIQMPPKSKLPADEIATLTRWVATGAAWPVDRSTPAHGSPSQVQPFNLAERARHWSWQPVRAPTPPAVHAATWPINQVDSFLLAKLEAAGIAPAAEADRATLIRRVTYDLIGLPPRPAEVAAFLNDPAPTTEAYGKVVDRLLGSPHYGERWARHWMDLVRFAESAGHEFDYDIPLAYRYRDYLIRAFNLDLPYDQFVVEQVAGDRLAQPRLDPATGLDESVLGTGFYRLGEGVHSPVDLRDDRAIRIDNQVDALGKTFLGLTIACARCHDHKFDAISTRDYYALTGFLTSSRHALTLLDPPSRNAPPLAELAEIRRGISQLLGSAAHGAQPAPVASTDEVFESFDGPTYGSWFVAGDAFGTGPTQPGAIRVDGNQVIPLPPGLAHSGTVSDRVRGALRSPTFTISRGKIHVLAAGRGRRFNVVIEGFERIRAPIYGGLVVDVDQGDAWRWRSVDVAAWVGLPAYIEIDDGGTVDYTGSQAVIEESRGFIAIDEIRFGDGPAPPLPVRAEPPPWPAENLAAIAPLVARYHEVEARLVEPTLGLGMTDGTRIEARVQIRGNTRSLGDPVTLRFLEVLGGATAAAEQGSGSGRLALAHAIASETNPLTARVLVNRLWHHHFGRGIVASVDDFGVMGQPPTHPELLDYLADRFVASGWSIKATHRLLVTSRAYRMSSAPTPEADGKDPLNLLFHRRQLGRLDAESIRDAILAVSGRLDPTLFGPSIPPHLTPFMDGRGRPGRSGPLDGAGRRTIYLNVRRNFLTPLLTAFDFPVPSGPMGRRNVSNVPAQALTLMNDPFLLAQARVWGQRIQTAYPEADPARGIDAMYLEAFGRPPTSPERSAAASFWAEARSDADAEADADAGQAWSDLAHVLFNVKEFVAIP